MIVEIRHEDGTTRLRVDDEREALRIARARGGVVRTPSGARVVDPRRER